MKKIPSIKSSRIVHSGFFSLREDLLECSGGDANLYTSILCTDATAVLAKDARGRWIINREYRHATGEVLLSCSGGRLEPGEDPLSGALREFFEETGYWSGDVRKLGVCHPFPSLCNQRIHYFFANGALKKGSQTLDPLECIEVELLEDEELRRSIREGMAVDGVLLTALCWHSLQFPRVFDNI